MKRFFLISVCILLCIQVGCDKKDVEAGAQTTGTVAQNPTAEMVSTQEAKKFSQGEWHRSNVATSLGATLVIKEVDEEGFDFELICMYYSHSGEVRDRAYFESDGKAVCQVAEGHGDQRETLTFELQDGVILVTASDGSRYLPFGANVTADGEYVKGEPAYTNADILSETFTRDELEIIKKTIDDEEIYEEYFKFPVEYGIVTVQNCLVEGKTSARLIDVYVPTMGGYDFVMLMTEDGEVYIDFGAPDLRYKTSVPGAIDFPEYEAD